MENQVDDFTALLKGMQARLDQQRHETLKHSLDASTSTATLQDLGSSWKPEDQAEAKDLQSSIKELWFKVEELTLQQQESTTFVPTPVTGAENSDALSPPSAAAAAAPSATSSVVTDQHQHQQQQAQGQQQLRKARRFWSRELHRGFVAALQRLGGVQVATPKQIRELMKVDGLTDDEVKTHLQNYRLHTRRRVSLDGGDQ